LQHLVRRFLVHGKVQGVFFRHSTRLEAERLAIWGVARNLPDGSVEVIARGTAAALQELRSWLHRGPAQARVDSVQESILEQDRNAEQSSSQDGANGLREGFFVR
jgi:acylphosphatase